jgi:hypothetical protein
LLNINKLRLFERHKLLASSGARTRLRRIAGAVRICKHFRPVKLDENQLAEGGIDAATKNQKVVYID